jgi:uncharacterized membrane protein YsdA (DUF1294 family)
MGNKSVSTKECVIREYPNIAFWLEGNAVRGSGNLILTSDRLIFLNRIVAEEWQLEEIRQLSSEEDFNKIVEFSLKLHKKNFQIPLADVTNVRMGLCSLFPFLRVCVRIYHLTRKANEAETSFWFRIPLFKGLFQFEITLVMGWIGAIKAAAKMKQKTTTPSYPTA